MKTLLIIGIVVAVSAFMVVPAQAQTSTPQPPPANVGGGTVSGFNFTLTGLIETAANLFNNLWPAFSIIAGVSLGFLILKFILSAVRGVFSG